MAQARAAKTGLLSRDRDDNVDAEETKPVPGEDRPGKGDLVIPRSVMRANKDLILPLIEAMGKAGLDPRQYIVIGAAGAPDYDAAPADRDAEVDDFLDHEMIDGPKGQKMSKDTVTAPRAWLSREGHPPAFLAYITAAEAKKLRKLDMHDSGIGKTMHFGPGNVPSFQGDGTGGDGSGGDTGGGTDGMAGSGDAGMDSQGPNGIAGSDDATAGMGGLAGDHDGDGDSDAADMGGGQRGYTGIGFIDRAIDRAVANPIATTINAVVSATPLGLVNTISGVLGGPTVGGMATAAGRSLSGQDDNGLGGKGGLGPGGGGEGKQGDNATGADQGLPSERKEPAEQTALKDPAPFRTGLLTPASNKLSNKPRTSPSDRFTTAYYRK